MKVGEFRVKVRNMNKTSYKIHIQRRRGSGHSYHTRCAPAATKQFIIDKDPKVEVLGITKADVAKIVRELKASAKEEATDALNVVKPAKKNVGQRLESDTSSDENDDDTPLAPLARKKATAQSSSKKRKAAVENEESSSSGEEISPPANKQKPSAKQTSPAASAFSPGIISQVLATHEGILKQGKDLSSDDMRDLIALQKHTLGME